MAAADLQAVRALAALRWASLSDVRLSQGDVVRRWIRLSVHASARLSGPFGRAGRSNRTCSAMRLASRVTSVTCTATVGWQHDGVGMARSMANTFKLRGVLEPAASRLEAQGSATRRGPWYDNQTGSTPVTAPVDQVLDRTVGWSRSELGLARPRLPACRQTHQATLTGGDPRRGGPLDRLRVGHGVLLAGIVFLAVGRPLPGAVEQHSGPHPVLLRTGDYGPAVSELCTG
jgi:hypothetical protein